MIKLAMYKGKGLLGNATVRAWTRSPYSHCELFESMTNTCMSSSLMDHGVRSKDIELDPLKWDVVDLPWASSRDVLQYFAQTDGEPYSWLDLIRGQFLNRPFDESKASFCSDWCAAALGIPNSTMYSPAALLDLCLYLNSVRAAAA